jgi:hypothetical protein
MTNLVPTLRVGTDMATLCVACGRGLAAERPEGRSHAERGNEETRIEEKTNP